MVVLTWNFICVCLLGRENRKWRKNNNKKTNPGSFYGVIDDQNDP